MKNIFVVMAVLVAGSMAKADGFVCTTESGLVVKVYNHTAAEEGTRTAAVMVISDSNIGAGNKTIARFTQANGTLSSNGAIYSADVDLRFNDSSRKGELIAGTKLGELKHLALLVRFSYSTPVEAGTVIPATLFLYKRNGTDIYEQANCLRYLKN